MDGERTTMQRGAFIITPAWTFHDHGNDSDQPVVRLDGLDIPIVRFFDAGFAEKLPTESQTTSRPEGDALARYGSNLLPIDFEARPTDPTRVFVYPWEKTHAVLNDIARTGAPDPHLGDRMRCVNPAIGASPMPTIGAFAQLLAADFETRELRSTDRTIYVCLEDAGDTEIGGRHWHFEENDIFVVPSWHALRLQALRDTLLFSFSDRPVQKALGLFRESRS